MIARRTAATPRAFPFFPGLEPGRADRHFHPPPLSFFRLQAERRDCAGDHHRHDHPAAAASRAPSRRLEPAAGPLPRPDGGRGRHVFHRPDPHAAVRPRRRGEISPCAGRRGDRQGGSPWAFVGPYGLSEAVERRPRSASTAIIPHVVVPDDRSGLGRTAAAFSALYRQGQLGAEVMDAPFFQEFAARTHRHHDRRGGGRDGR